MADILFHYGFLGDSCCQMVGYGDGAGGVSCHVMFVDETQRLDYSVGLEDLLMDIYASPGQSWVFKYPDREDVHRKWVQGWKDSKGSKA